MSKALRCSAIVGPRRTAGNRRYRGYVWLRAAGKKAGAIEVSLVWGETPNDRATVRLEATGGDYVRRTFAFKAGATLH